MAPFRPPLPPLLQPPLYTAPYLSNSSINTFSQISKFSEHMEMKQIDMHLVVLLGAYKPPTPPQLTLAQIFFILLDDSTLLYQQSTQIYFLKPIFTNFYQLLVFKNMKVPFKSTLLHERCSII